MRRRIDSAEMKTSLLTDYGLLALAYLGGKASKDAVLDRMQALLEGRLTSADWQPMHQTPVGQKLAPAGTQDRTWAVWQGKATTGLRLHAPKSGYVIRDENGFTLTQAGYQRVFGFAAEFLARGESH